MSFDPLAFSDFSQAGKPTGVTRLHNLPQEINGLMYNLITFLGAAQQLGRHFLPITWQKSLESHGRGGTARVKHSLLTRDVSLSFKHVNPEFFRNPHHQDEESVKAQAYYTLISEISQLFMVHPNIVRLLGISWEIASNGVVWPVLVFNRAAHGDLKMFIAGLDTAPPWELRYRMICGVARALDYMHAGRESIHGCGGNHKC